MNQKLTRTIVTCGGLGYSPMAPGTVASGVTCLAVYFLGHVSFFLALIVTILSLRVVRIYLQDFSDVAVDPPHVVLDEVVGQLWAFVGVKVTVWTLLLGFIGFRVFDIMKPGIIRQAEALPGAYGVVFDDVLAGGATMIILNIIGSYV